MTVGQRGLSPYNLAYFHGVDTAGEHRSSGRQGEYSMRRGHGKTLGY